MYPLRAREHPSGFARGRQDGGELTNSLIRSGCENCSSVLSSALRWFGKLTTYGTDSHAHAVGFVCLERLFLGQTRAVPKCDASERVGGNNCVVAIVSNFPPHQLPNSRKYSDTPHNRTLLIPVALLPGSSAILLHLFDNRPGLESDSADRPP